MQQSPLWQSARNRYELLGVKDRRAIQILSIALICTLVYVLVWDPITQWEEEQEAGYQHQVSVNDWLQNNQQRAKDQKKNQKGGIGQRELSSVVGSVARKSNVTLSRVQPDKKGLSVWIEDAAYQKLLAWLVVLENQFGVQVQQIRIDKLKEEGRVKAFLHLAN